MHAIRLNHTQSKWLLASLVVGLTITASLLLVADFPVAAQGSPLHPTFPLLDENGDHVLDSGQPVSTMKTCGTCHDTDFIEQHSFHAEVGLNSYSADFEGGYSWDTSPGYFGRWDPITYRYLSPAGDEVVDMTTAEWLQTLGARHVGGGPAIYSRDGQQLTDLPVTTDNPETTFINPETGEMTLWDWQESGLV